MNVRGLAGVGTLLLSTCLSALVFQAPVRAQQAQQPSAAPAAAPAAPGRGRGAAMVRMLSPGKDLGYRYNPDPLPIPENLKCKVTEKTPRCGVNGFAFQVGSVAQDAKGHIYVAQRS